MDEVKSPKRLYRSNTDKVVSGVLGGIGEFLGLDPALIRAVFILILFVTGLFPFALGYIIAAFVMPMPPAEFMPSLPGKKYFRSTADRKLFGILGGLAEYFNFDPTALRLIFILLVCATGVVPGTIGYFAAWFVAPARS